MEKIEGLDLNEIADETLKVLIDEKKRSVSGMVRILISRIQTIDSEINHAEKSLESKKKSLDQAKAKLAKVRSGDWSVLSENKQENKKDENQSESDTSKP